MLHRVLDLHPRSACLEDTEVLVLRSLWLQYPLAPTIVIFLGHSPPPVLAFHGHVTAGCVVFFLKCRVALHYLGTQGNPHSPTLHNLGWRCQRKIGPVSQVGSFFLSYLSPFLSFLLFSIPI